MNCLQCQSPFEITPADQRYYKEWGVPEPVFCPDCRHQTRCAYRNERKLYKRTCDLCKKPIVTVYTPSAPYPVLCQSCWWGDKWDPMRVGMDFDFSRPFFDQFYELQKKVPRLALNNIRSINSDFCNLCAGNKDCYLIFASDENQDCYYSYWINRCEDCFNCGYLADSRQCIECMECENCHRCIYSQQMKNCSECIFCFDMIGCKNCFGCTGLRNAEYHIYNKPVKKEEYEKKLAEVFLEKLSTRANFQALKDWYRELKMKTPRRYAMIISSEDCTGDYIYNSRGCEQCFEVFDSENCRYSYFMVHQNFNCVDTSFVTECRNSYQSLSVVGGEGIRFSIYCWYDSNILYSDLCMNSEELFGCVGLNKANHCILNKKYKPEAYKELRQKIVAHMSASGGTGEWGQFFPIKNSPFPYNDTAAQDYYPLNQEQVLAKGWQWNSETSAVPSGEYVALPEDIKQVTDAVLKHKILCRKCGRGYRVMKRELNIYRVNFIPLPEICPDCRHLRRLKKKNHYSLYNRTCQKCGKALQTSYAPNRQEIVYCEECYYQIRY
ncbi:hypothetical protein HZA43_02095 [Candidatus Peregrinibacteria bacterium]|nr:hypothetical protein [Candidatus Peregrinibacteria bacterium]